MTLKELEIGKSAVIETVGGSGGDGGKAGSDGGSHGIAGARL